MALAALALLPGAAGHAAARGERCFGAPARDPASGCAPDRSVQVHPLPADARASVVPCDPVIEPPSLVACRFGIAPEDAAEEVALVGDSHASGLRDAVDVVARARGWSGRSLTHTSCPLSTAVRDLREPSRFASCADWKSRVFRWFAEHPEVRTVVVAGLTGGTGVLPAQGLSRFETAVSGYLEAWARLPETVERIIVIRDTPKAWPVTRRCVDIGLRFRIDPGALCAVPRGEALDPDPMVVAAERLRSPRVRVVDLTPSFCDELFCLPVVGGALVHRDTTHLTAVFAATLGPALRREVARVLAP